ncbi:uncharacterized protein [Aegilops tauschii subsp. strangulata]|uniref:uncharacterized protein n=1 Tax=Aegilops tauschii subsp. strangulata TaxID=200361 RepID=UPI003CC845E3
MAPKTMVEADHDSKEWEFAAIPIREGVQDFIVWQFDSKGMHSVKSAYKLQVQWEKQAKSGDVGSSSTHIGNLDRCDDDSWKRLWKLPYPKNVQMFPWRIKHESLALWTNLQKRGIPIESTKCLFCERADEDGAHLFIKCKAVKEVWRDLSMEERIELEKIQSMHVMLDFLWGLSESKRVQILTMWWMWWSNQNRIREGEIPQMAYVVARRTRACALEYQQIYSVKQTARTPDKWRPPCGDKININVDGAFVPGSEHAGWGVVARSEDGHIICARAGRQENVTDAFVAEAYAMSHALSLAANLGVVQVVFESDLQLLVDALDLRKADSSAYSALIEDTKLQLNLWFSK